MEEIQMVLPVTSGPVSKFEPDSFSQFTGLSSITAGQLTQQLSCTLGFYNDSSILTDTVNQCVESVVQGFFECSKALFPCYFGTNSELEKMRSCIPETYLNLKMQNSIQENQFAKAANIYFEFSGNVMDMQANSPCLESFEGRWRPNSNTQIDANMHLGLIKKAEDAKAPFSNIIDIIKANPGSCFVAGGKSTAAYYIANKYIPSQCDKAQQALEFCTDAQENLKLGNTWAPRKQFMDAAAWIRHLLDRANSEEYVHESCVPLVDFLGKMAESSQFGVASSSPADQHQRNTVAGEIHNWVYSNQFFESFCSDLNNPFSM